MTADLGRHLSIRSTTYVAGKPVPFFWPMRSFIHHNPLHGLEHLPFAEAVELGADLFHAVGFLPRASYQRYLAEDSLRQQDLVSQLKAFAANSGVIPGIDLAQWAETLLIEFEDPISPRNLIVAPADIHAALRGQPVDLEEGGADDTAFIDRYLRAALLGDKPVYDAVDALYGTAIGDELNELVVRACLDFFDEGQSVWIMPNREKGFFSAWRQVAGVRARALLSKIEAGQADAGNGLAPEKVIDHIMGELGVPEELWTSCFTRELAHLHGWAGFIRWRASAKHYYWSESFPGDLVDLLAVRLTLAWLLLRKRAGKRLPTTTSDLESLIETRPFEAYLRLELNGGRVLPNMIPAVEAALARGKQQQIAQVCKQYVRQKRASQAAGLAEKLRALADKVGERAALGKLSADDLSRLVDALVKLEAGEGMIWLRAMEARAIDDLLPEVSIEPAPVGDKRPFVQAAFCIDTRSERIRRHLEAVGDYQTFGIAGFFGVPVSLIELGKGSEAHLCPVLLTPKNLVLEMSAAVWSDEAALSTLKHVMHELKESVVSPFVTVEAIGLLFGFDMIGKTMVPQAYNDWRKRLHKDKPNTHLLHDKLGREQAESIVRAVQRAVIVEVLEQELNIPTEEVNDDIVRDVRELALGNIDLTPEIADKLKLSKAEAETFVGRLRKAYRINPSFTRLQLEQLGRIGFSLDEQVGFVRQALRSIGLTENFSRFVLLVGHGSSSENNPYESALDCGACGGSHGLYSARVLAQMANKPAVRKRLAEQGIQIPDDAWFVPAFHNTTTDELGLHDLELLPTTHLIYLDRLRTGMTSAARLCAQERLPTLRAGAKPNDPLAAFRETRRNAVDWSQVRPEWGLAQNAYFIIGRRNLTRHLGLDGRAFLHSYDHSIDGNNRLLETILTGPLVVGQWINMEHYFSAVDNERFGSGSKVYHNVAGRFGVMTGNLSDLRTGLPSQTVLDKGEPYHQPIRLITIIEAPFERTLAAIESVVAVKRLVNNGWIRLVIVDPETGKTHIYTESEWVESQSHQSAHEEQTAS